MAPDQIPPPQRSLLAVPATSPRFLEKSTQCAADAIFIDLEDAVVPEGMRAESLRAAALGYEGKMAIHPSQIEIANEVFSPSARELAWAREALDAMAAAGAQGRGAVKTADGKMIDLVHIKIARKILARAERIATRR